MWHEYSEWKRVYCWFPRTLMNTNEKQRGVLYRRVLEVDDCGQHMRFVDYIDEKTYFKIKLKGQHEARSHP